MDEPLITEGRPRFNFDSWIVVILLAFSLGLNVYLTLRLRAGSGERLSPTLMKVGARMPTLEGEDLDGARTALEWAADSRPTVMYVFTPSCIWCRRNIANIKALSAAGGSNYRFVGVSLTSTRLKSYVEESGFTFPIYVVSDKATVRQLGLASTPQTMVISNDGSVVKNWSGAYTGPVQSEIEKMFAIHLPGLAPAPPHL